VHLGDDIGIEIDAASRRLWQAHLRGDLTWDEWLTMCRIIGVAGYPLQRFIITETV
jgi:hypothetical protein